MSVNGPARWSWLQKLWLRGVAATVPALLLPACESQGSPQQCVTLRPEIEPGSCTPQYPAVFDEVFTNTLSPRCDVAGSSCHAQSDALGARGGLVFNDIEVAYDALLDPMADRVRPNEPDCGALVERLTTEDDSRRMPPGQTGLPDAELCSVLGWIDAGAER